MRIRSASTHKAFRTPTATASAPPAATIRGCVQVVVSCQAVASRVSKASGVAACRIEVISEFETDEKKSRGAKHTVAPTTPAIAVGSTGSARRGTPAESRKQPHRSAWTPLPTCAQGEAQATPPGAFAAPVPLDLAVSGCGVRGREPNQD